jgi:hypothetical protein
MTASTNKDTGSNSGNYAAPALDSIAEVKVQASNFQAEYGRSSGRDDHRRHQERQPQLPRIGGVLPRNEDYNSNTWERRRSCDANPSCNGARTLTATRRRIATTTRRGRSAVPS